jgi:UDP:flavonoid glycosyltransferase YjiC (YdhE family)
MRVLCSTTANDGHFGPLLPFARACLATGHDVRVAAPRSYGDVLARAGLRHEAFAEPPPELIAPVMAGLPAMSFEEADEVVVRDVFGRIDAQAALPSLLDAVERWRPDVVVRESAEVASLAAAEHVGVPHVHVCIGMHEVLTRFADAIAEPLEELGRLAGLDEGHLASALASETVLSLVPELLDLATGEVPPEAAAFHRFHEPAPRTDGPRPAAWGDPDLPLVYVTFGSVAGSLPPFAGVFREALDARAPLDACVVMTVGRTLDPRDLGATPANAHVVQWLPQHGVLAHAAAMLGHGGFGTTMGALAAGVPQVVAPLFSFDQAVNGHHVASVGAGVTTGIGTGGVGRAAAEIPRLLEAPTYAESARRVAAAMRELPPPAEAVPILAGLVG